MEKIDGYDEVSTEAPTAQTMRGLRVVGDAGITLDNDLDAVGRVVALCGGLPLALRIAGALRVHDHPRPY